MNCNHAREDLIELLSGEMANPVLAARVKECSNCARELESLRKTMAVLDEWEAPEPTPYFLTRLQAHVREEKEQPKGWFSWLRQPALAVSLAAVLVAGGAVLLHRGPDVPNGPPQVGSAVADLEALDKNSDLYVNSDLLDEMTGGPSDDVSE
jgi:hypothetical protein